MTRTSREAIVSLDKSSPAHQDIAVRSNVGAVIRIHAARQCSSRAWVLMRIRSSILLCQGRKVKRHGKDVLGSNVSRPGQNSFCLSRGAHIRILASESKKNMLLQKLERAFSRQRFLLCSQRVWTQMQQIRPKRLVCCAIFLPQHL